MEPDTQVETRRQGFREPIRFERRLETALSLLEGAQNDSGPVLAGVERSAINRVLQGAVDIPLYIQIITVLE